MTENNYIYGKNPVCEALENNPKRINIIIQKNNLRKFDEFFEEKPNYQGVVASVAPISTIDVEEFVNNKKDGFKRIVALDNVSDPHNLGAIIRTVAAAGFDAVMISTHRSCPINATVEKISSGAINHIPIIKTTSLNASLDYLKKQDYWVIATQMEAYDNYYEIDYTDMNFVVVMGSEGSGISKTILNKADFTIKLESNFESLNVSAATAVIIYEAKRQIDLKNKKNKK